MDQKIGEKITTFKYTHIFLNRETVTSFHVSLFLWGPLLIALAENMVVMLGCYFSQFLEFTTVANFCKNNSFYIGKYK
jgi:hypothetical protein